jgi:hypothetical protein
LAPMRLLPASPMARTSRSYGPLAPTPRISIHWPTGWWRVVSRPLPWNPRASIGFPCLRHWKPAASTAASSAPGPSSASLAARVTFWTASGSRLCTAMGDSPLPFVRRRTSWRCAPCYAIAPNSSSLAPRTSSPCKRPYYR